MSGIEKGAEDPNVIKAFTPALVGRSKLRTAFGVSEVIAPVVGVAEFSDRSESLVLLHQRETKGNISIKHYVTDAMEYDIPSLIIAFRILNARSIFPSTEYLEDILWGCYAAANSRELMPDPHFLNNAEHFEKLARQGLRTITEGEIDGLMGLFQVKRVAFNWRNLLRLQTEGVIPSTTTSRILLTQYLN